MCRDAAWAYTCWNSTANPPRSANARSWPARSILPTCAHGATGSTASANAAATRRWTSAPSRTAARARLIGRAAVPGADPCHVSVNPVARQLYVSNCSGELLCYALDDKGPARRRAAGSGARARGRAPTARTARTRISRCPMPPARMCTCATWAPTRSSAIACRPTAWRRSRLDAACAARLGAAPSGLAGALIVAVNELSNTLSVYGQAEGCANPPRELAHANAAARLDRRQLAAALRLHPNGRLLMVSNRGHDSIAAFRLRRDAPWLEPLGHFPPAGARRATSPSRPTAPSC